MPVINRFSIQELNHQYSVHVLMCVVNRISTSLPRIPFCLSAQVINQLEESVEVGNRKMIKPSLSYSKDIKHILFGMSQ